MNKKQRVLMHELLEAVKKATESVPHDEYGRGIYNEMLATAEDRKPNLKEKP
jgi:hypothetical protein